MKKIMAGAAVAVSVVGVSAAAAAPALAIGNDDGPISASGNGAKSKFGNTVTTGDMSPQAQLIQGSLNKLCVGAPVKANVGSLVGVLVPIAVQDVQVLSNPQNQQCAENSTQAKQDEPLSHLINNIPVLSGNGVANG
ncbi:MULTISPECIES: rodlin [unclassified Streptomyces]|uniref:rodlin n=1 Tax=unclassified Streptomyces TaxID=2593676 RepID=UPI0038179FED